MVTVIDEAKKSEIVHRAFDIMLKDYPHHHERLLIGTMAECHGLDVDTVYDWCQVFEDDPTTSTPDL